MKQLFFTAGPSALFYTVEEHIKQALKEQVPSISHRSKAYEKLSKETTDNLRELLNVPNDYHLFFTSSASEVWSLLIENCVKKESFHIVNGAFSKKFYNTAIALNRRAGIHEISEGTCTSIDKVNIPKSAELITIAQNETSTGAAQPLEDIYKLKALHPDKIVAVDCVSALPYIDIDLKQIDSLYFSVQKGFGLPAGLGVWIVNNKCVDKAISLKEKQVSIGSYHSIPSFLEKAKKHQTPATPNVLAIYVLGKVAKDMLDRGIESIRRETVYKAAILYNMIKDHTILSPFVENEKHQSKTVIVANTSIPSSEIIAAAAKKGMILSAGYGKNKDSQIRIANFPAHSKEQFEMLVDFLAEFKAV